MILGFLGKGGSGKSSVSSQMALFLNQRGQSVLAVDADHNMDLSYNLTGGAIPEHTYISQSLPSLLQAVGLETGEKYDQVFLQETAARFRLSPVDAVVADYSTVLENGIRLMTAGPQTDAVLHGQGCSHVLSTPLKVLLPLLELSANETVVVDEKAGADGVSTGIVTGIDVGVIVCEPALHSIKTARQIAELMDFYGTPYIFVANKIASAEDKDFIVTELGHEPAVFLMDSNSLKRNPSVSVTEWMDELQIIYETAKTHNENDRLERTAVKFKRNEEFATT